MKKNQNTQNKAKNISSN